SAVLAADTYLQIAATRAARLHGPLDELAHTLLVQHSERIILEDLLFFVILLEVGVVVARQAHSGLREIVGAEAEKLGLLGDLFPGQRAAWISHYGPPQIFELLPPPLFQHVFSTLDYDFFLFPQLLPPADERNHDFRNDLDSLLGYLHCGFEDRPR